MRGLFGLGRIPAIMGSGIATGMGFLSLIIIKGVMAGTLIIVQKSYYEIHRKLAIPHIPFESEKVCIKQAENLSGYPDEG